SNTVQLLPVSQLRDSADTPIGSSCVRVRSRQGAHCLSPQAGSCKNCGAIRSSATLLFQQPCARAIVCFGQRLDVMQTECHSLGQLSQSVRCKAVAMLQDLVVLAQAADARSLLSLPSLQ